MRITEPHSFTPQRQVPYVPARQNRPHDVHHVAAAAGVSQATVSLVLNDAGGARVSDGTRQGGLRLHVSPGGGCPGRLGEVPAVVLNAQDRSGTFPSIAPAEVLGGYTATKRLIDAGHRRIGFINIGDVPDGLPAVVGRLEGYRQALAEAGIDADDHLHSPGDGHEDGGYRNTLKLMAGPHPPTAIFCGNDRTAWGAYQALASLGLSVPGDVSVMGFDNQESLAPHLRPGLTTLELPFIEMGRRAVELILAGTLPPGHTEVFECPLIERHSVAQPPHLPTQRTGTE